MSRVKNAFLYTDLSLPTIVDNSARLLLRQKMKCNRVMIIPQSLITNKKKFTARLLVAPTGILTKGVLCGKTVCIRFWQPNNSGS